MDKQYTTRQLTEAEAEALTKDMTEVLEKHGADMGVVATIQIMKRVEVSEEGIKSPFIVQNGENPTTTEESPKTD